MFLGTRDIRRLGDAVIACERTGCVERGRLPQRSVVVADDVQALNSSGLCLPDAFRVVPPSSFGRRLDFHSHSLPPSHHRPLPRKPLLSPLTSQLLTLHDRHNPCLLRTPHRPLHLVPLSLPRESFVGTGPRKVYIWGMWVIVGVWGCFVGLERRLGFGGGGGEKDGPGVVVFCYVVFLWERRVDVLWCVLL